MDFTNYLDSNKEWLFSGVGAVIVAGIGRAIYLFISRRRVIGGRGTAVQTTGEARQAPPQEVATHPQAKITRLTSLTADEIIQTIKNAPPLQRSEIAKKYEGIAIEWQTYLFNASQEENNNVRLSLDFQKGTSLVFCNVKLSDYSELGISPRGTPITVIGRIAKVNEMTGIDLRDVQLFIGG